MRLNKLSCICFLLRVVVCNSRTGFIKDQNENKVEFPPLVMTSSRLSSNHRIPTGHLRPLGWQKPPSGEILQMDVIPDSEYFYAVFVQSPQPVVLRNLIKNASTLNKWANQSYLIEKYGTVLVNVVLKKERRTEMPRQMSFKQFLTEFLYEDLYLMNDVPYEMMADFPLPGCLRCEFSKWLMRSQLWMSSGGTSSLLHSHADHDVHCVVSGRKDFIFIDRRFRDAFQFQPHALFSDSGKSYIDVDQINMFHHGQIADVPWKWTTLRSGDCVFIPAGLLRQVRSYGRAVSYTTQFTPTPDFDTTQLSSEFCKNTENVSVTLRDAEFMWHHRNGRQVLRDNQLTAETLRHLLLRLMRNATNLTYDSLKEFHSRHVHGSDVKREDIDDLNEVWSLLSSESRTNKNVLSRADIRSLAGGLLHNIAEQLNNRHPVNNIELNQNKIRNEL